MIESLLIRNVALIDRAEIEFSEGLNILSGETGAGKSVILDSINFILGAKAEKSMIRYGESECFVQAAFWVAEDSEALKALGELDIESDGTILVTRRLTDTGRSVIKVNGVTVNAAMLRQVTSHLVDVHGQSEHFYLLKESNQLHVLDQAVGEDAAQLKREIKALRDERKELLDTIASLGGDAGERERRIDVLRFQIDEIADANIMDGEEEELLSIRNKLNHIEKIMDAVSVAAAALTGEDSALDRIVAAVRQMASVSKFDEEYAKLSERLDALRLDAEDIGETLSDIADSLTYDEGEAQRVEDRLDLIRLIKKKYGGSIASANAYLTKAREEYDRLTHCDEEIALAEKQLASCEKKLFVTARKLTAARENVAKSLEAGVVSELKTLNIKNARFVVEFTPYDETDIASIGTEGADNIRFLFSANAGEPLKPLGKIISGGEMSRFMLALKTQLSDVNEISTYVFDEIDAGISGVTAKVVAQKFANIARKTQIIAVSHLAQIASMSDREMLIEKREEDGKTHTIVKTLSEDERLGEIIRLIGGNSDSDHAIAHAKELIEESRKYKENLS